MTTPKFPRAELEAYVLFSDGVPLPGGMRAVLRQAIKAHHALEVENAKLLAELDAIGIKVGAGPYPR